MGVYTTIDDPSVYFQTALYTGNGGGSQAVTNDGNSNLQPDWLWIKERSSDSAHTLFDSTRGASKQIYANNTDAEQSASALSSFNTDGFTVGSDGKTNENSQTYVGWQWKANGGTTSTNNDGSVAVTLQANTTAGFSIGTFTSNGNTSGTIGHGLGARPDMIITKKRNSIGNWNVIVPDYASNKMGSLNSTDAFSVASGINTVGTSTFTDGDGADSNTRVFYAFKSIQGYSKIGSFKGNGNADGPFVYTGFKPAWLLVKNADASHDWHLFDNKRLGINPANERISPNRNNAAVSDDPAFDFLSNGFKGRTASSARNENNETIIYMAFAEHPFVSSAGVPTTAR